MRKNHHSRPAGRTCCGQVVTLFTLGLWVAVSGCGNKGDLYLPSDVIQAEELEEVSDKLKKKKPDGDAVIE